MTESGEAAEIEKAAIRGRQNGRQATGHLRQRIFLKERHLLGFDNAKKALLTTVREAVDNSLDACEEAKISPEILIEIKQLEEDRFTVIVADNGPGVVKNKSAHLRETSLRFQISFDEAEPRPTRHRYFGGRHVRPAHHRISDQNHLSHFREKARALFEIQIDTAKNQPTVIKDEIVHGSGRTGPKWRLNLRPNSRKAATPSKIMCGKLLFPILTSNSLITDRTAPKNITSRPAARCPFNPRN